MPANTLSLVSIVVTATFVCHLDWSTAHSLRPSALVNSSILEPPTVPNDVASVSSATIEKRSDEGDDGEQSRSLFRSFIPISPFKKPIKTIFRSLFEPSDDSTAGSSFYFIRPQKKSVSGPAVYQKSVDISPLQTSPYRYYSSKYINRQSNGRSQYAYQPSAAANTNYGSVSRSQSGSPSFAIGDPANGRGLTVSLGDGPQSNAQYGVATNHNYQNAASGTSQTSQSTDSSSSGNGGGGLSFSLGGRGGGSGLSFSLGGAGGASPASGLSLSLGGGRGMNLNLGGSGGESSQQGSSSSNYASYSGSGGSPSYGSNSYGSPSYGSSYGSGYKNYYPTKPKFSITMPSSGKTVLEANLGPPKLKMKLNASPKVKITTGTRDPLEKPPLEEEVIMEDIFGPPAPFEKPMKSNTTADNSTLANGFNQTFPYPYYPPYYPYNYYYQYYQQQYPGYYPPSVPSNGYQGKTPSYGSGYPQYPGSYGSQYGSQYGSPYGSSYGSQYGSSYSRQNASSTIYKHAPIELAAAASKNKWQSLPVQASQTLSAKRALYPTETPSSALQYLSYPQATTSQKQLYEELSVPAKSNFMDHNNVNYKRSSASSSYNKDMLTLSSNSIASYAKPDSVRNPKKYLKGQESKNYYHYEPALPVRKGGLGLNSVASSATDPYPYYSHPGTGAGYSHYNGSSVHNSTYPGYQSGYYHPYYNPYYYNYYKEYYNYAKQYYESYYGNTSALHNGTGNSTNRPYYKNRKSISGFSQSNFDHHQSKIFGSKLDKYPGGSTKEDKARIIMDIRPRVTFRMLNRTQAEEEHKHLHHKKKKDHIFKTKLTILMATTTTSTAKPSYGNNYYGYNYYEDDADEFGYTKASTIHDSLTTVRPKTTTTRRRTTTTEEPSSSGEGSEEENGSAENTSQEEEASSTTSTTTEAPEEDNSVSEEVDDGKSPEQPTSTTSTTTTTESSQSEEVIEGNEEASEEASTDKESETQSEEKSEDENSSLEVGKTVTIPASATGGNVTVSPELVAAMIKALQEALGVTPAPIGSILTTTTPSPMSNLTPLGEDAEDETTEEDTNDMTTNTGATDSNENNDTEPGEPEEEEDGNTVATTTTTTRKPKNKGAY